jgi:hypothetical protein
VVGWADAGASGSGAGAGMSRAYRERATVAWAGVTEASAGRCAGERP